MFGIVFGVVKNNAGDAPTTALTGPLNTDTWTSSADYYNTTWSGSGTEADPYLIENAAGLALLANNVNRGSTYSEKYFKQTANIDLRDHYWDGIGAVNNNYFAGHYDGGGFTISNLFTTGRVTPSGLFGQVGNSSYRGYISNVSIVESTINGFHSAGAIVGEAVDLTISNCHNSAQVIGSGQAIGGLIGSASSVTMTSCYNTADVSGESYVGGLIGQINYTGTGSNIREIERCYNTGNISGQSYIGGLIGRDYATAFHSLTLQENYNVGDVSAQSGDAGGLIGQYTAYGALTLQDNYNAGDVISSSGHAGGIIGELYSSLSVSGRSSVMSTANIYNCMNFGDVSMTSTSNYYAGGIIGNLYSYVYSSGTGLFATADATATVNIANVLNNGTITNNNGYTGDTGGIIGYQNFSVNEAERYSNSTANFNMSFAYNLGAIQSSARKGGLIGYKGQNIQRGDLVYTLKKNVYGGACDANVGGINGKDEANAKFDETLSQSQLKTLEFYNTIGKWDPGNWFMFGVTWQLDENINDGFPSLILSDANETLDSWTSDSSYYDTAWAGTGAEGDPYLIENAADLAGLAYNVSAGTNYSGLYFKQTANIDLAEHMWSAIGTSSRSFNGNYDGGNFEISNMYIDAGTSDYKGLFGYINSAVISNVNVVDANITGYQYVAGVVGYAINSTIQYANFDGTIVSETGSLSSWVAGIVAYAQNSIVESCSASGSVNSSGAYAGGIVGNMDSTSAIYNCSNSANVTSSSSNIGGIVGYVNSNNSSFGIIQNCYNSGNIIGPSHVGGIVGDQNNNSSGGGIAHLMIIGCQNDGVIFGSDYVGGIAGEGGARACYNTGDIFGVGTYSGGIVGVGAAQDCYNLADVSGYNYVGGIAGTLNGENSAVANVYNTGSVSGDDYVAGIVGYLPSLLDTNALVKGVFNSINLGSVSGLENIAPIIAIQNGGESSYAFNCYYGGNCIQIEEWQNSGLGLYSPTIENDAKDITFYQNIDNWDVKYQWDFDNIWQISAQLNDGFPSFKEDIQIDIDDVKIIAQSLYFPFQETEGWYGPKKSETDGWSYMSYFTIEGELWEAAKTYNANDVLGTLPTVEDGEDYTFLYWAAINDQSSSATITEITADTPVSSLSMNEIYAVYDVKTWMDYRSSGLQMQGTDFLITSAADLAFVAYEVSQGNSLYINGSYIQTQNIDLSAHFWSPIGTEEHPFAGNYDGNGFTISGIKYYAGIYEVMSLLTTSGGAQPYTLKDYNSLFGYIIGQSDESRSSICNIGVIGDDIQSFKPVSSIAGYAQYVNFDNCYNQTNIRGLAYGLCAGLVCYATDCTFNSCYNEGMIGASTITNAYDKISSAENAGELEDVMDQFNVYSAISTSFASGLIGLSNNITLMECHNSGSFGAANYSAGLIILTNVENNLEDATAVEGSVTRILNCYNDADGGSMMYASGLVAAAYNQTIIDNCYNAGDMAGVLLGISAGIAGQGDGITISNSYNSGGIIASLGAGGLLGAVDSNSSATNKIVNSFNVGLVDNIDLGTNLDGMDQFGGILGSSSTNIEIENTYYGGNCGQIGGVDGSDTSGTTYLPTLADDAQSEEWFQNESLWNPDYPWNIGEDWFIVDGYPTLEAPITWLDDPSYYDHEFTGLGTQASPYLITSNKELAGVAYLMLNYNDTYKNSYFRLTTDVDMSEYFWVPIGTTNALAFAGHFDGGNYPISGVKTLSSWSGSGLFGTVIGTSAAHAVIENVIMENFAIRANSYGGGVVGVGEYVEISNCRVIGETNTLKGSRAGGVIGYAMNSEVRDSYNNGTIEASGDYLGGVVGYANLSQVENCYATVSASFTGITRGVVTNADSGNVGGLVGGAESSTIANCFNAGPTSGSWGISADGLQSMMTILSTGGIIGFAKTQAIVTDCYNLGLVSCDIMANGGGIAGKSDGATIQNCYNKGSLTSTTNLEGGIMAFGGIVGSPINSTILKCTNYAGIDYYYGYAGGIAGMGIDILLIMMGGDVNSYLENLTTTTIQNCYNYGAIETIVAGGIAGMSTKYNFIDCVNVGDVGFYDATENSGSQGAAGIAAMAMGENSFERCYNIGNITGLDYLAGIVSQIQSLVDEEYAEISLNHCFNAGTLNMPDAGTASGLVGYATRAILTISNSASVGDVVYTNTSNSSTYTAGILGLIEGYSQSITISNCLVDMDVSLSIVGNTNIVAGIARTISATTVSIENCAIKMNVNSSSTLADENISSFYYDSSFQPSDVVSNSYSLITNNTTGTENNVVLDNGGMDGNFVYVEGMFDGMAVPVNIYHIDGYITSTGILEYLQQTFNVQPFVAA